MRWDVCMNWIMNEPSCFVARCKQTAIRCLRCMVVTLGGLNCGPTLVKHFRGFGKCTIRIVWRTARFSSWIIILLSVYITSWKWFISVCDNWYSWLFVHMNQDSLTNHKWITNFGLDTKQIYEFILNNVFLRMWGDASNRLY